MEIDLNLLIFAIVFLLIVILVYIYRHRIFDNFNNSNYSEYSSPDPKSLDTSLLDENGFLKKNETNKDITPSYWYNYAPGETRSKCFACDAASNLQHGSRCIDCEKKGGRPVDELFNKVLTR
jgi:hypothetical protein